MCISKVTGKPLAKYCTKEMALESARYQKMIHNLDLFPYKCEKCGCWHLTPIRPEERISKIEGACRCRDSLGRSKLLYLSRDDAERMRNKLWDTLFIYECPENPGCYHLTKRWHGNW